MRNDLAFARDLHRCSFGTFANRIVHKIARHAANGLRSRYDGIDHGTDGAWKLRVLLDDIAGGGNSPASLVTHDDNQANPEVFDPVFDRPHCRRIDHVARIAGDEELADTKPAKQQLRWYAAVGASNDRRPWGLRPRHVFALV